MMALYISTAYIVALCKILLLTSIPIYLVWNMNLYYNFFYEKLLCHFTLITCFFFSFSFADSQLDGAVSWMHSNWLTKFDNASDFMSTQSLRRDEATKFFVQYAKESLGLSPDTSKSCNFTDLDKARPDLKDLIKESCQLGLFQWYNWKFMPTQSLTNAQAITVLIRMIDGNKDETQWHWAQK